MPSTLDSMTWGQALAHNNHSYGQPSCPGGACRALLAIQTSTVFMLDPRASCAPSCYLGMPARCQAMHGPSGDSSVLLDFIWQVGVGHVYPAGFQHSVCP